MKPSKFSPFGSAKATNGVSVALRERIGLNPGTEVEFVTNEKVLRVKPRKRRNATSSDDHWLSNAAGSAKAGMTTDEIMALTRGED